jgi:hypothetical protein
MGERRSLPQVKSALSRILFAGRRESERDPCTASVVHALADDAFAAGEAAGEGREHIAALTADQAAALLQWLERPSGSISVGLAVFEAVTGGGVLVRTRPWRASRG